MKKTIDKGTSASRMVNRPVITFGTGKDCWEMTFKDTITPNGVNYEVGNYKLVDKTDGHEFPTWRPNPDKSWIVKGADGKWAAVVDPECTNRTGADTMTFLDHSAVASVVNGTISVDLVQAPTKVELTDDWAKADYLFDATSDKSRCSDT